MCKFYRKDRGYVYDIRQFKLSYMHAASTWKKVLFWRLSALLQLHLHSRLNTWVQWFVQRQLQDDMRNIKVWGFGASHIRGLTIYLTDNDHHPTRFATIEAEVVCRSLGTSTVYWCIASKLKAARNLYWMSNMFLWLEIFLFFVCYHVVPKRHSQLDYELNDW